jgi:hypothetical protein
MTSHIVLINTISKSEAPTVIKAWNEEDQYREMKGLSHELNRKARPYPYIASSECLRSTIDVEVEVPVQGPLNLVYLDGQSDAGLPHTRGLTGIALPVFLLWEPSAKTIQHEIVHLSQKQNKERWWSFYRGQWSFREATADEFTSIPERWRRRRRINPDTMGSPYTVWKDRYIPLSVFSSDITPDLKSCKRGFWDLRMSQWTWETPPGWTEMFGKGFNDEHPNEIAAHWIDGSAGPERAKKVCIFV